MSAVPHPLRLTPAQRYAAAFVPALLVLVFGATVYWGTLREQRSRGEVDANHRTIEQLQQVLTATVRGQSAQRAYRLTGDPALLARVDSSAADARRALAALPRLMADDAPAVRAQGDSLRAVVGRVFAELRPSAGDAAVPSPTTARAVRLANALTAVEERQLAAHDAGEARVSRALVVLVVLGTAASAAVSLLLNALLSRYGAGQAAFAGAMARANRRLEEQQGELEQQYEQLQAQSGELEAQSARLQQQAAELEVKNAALERLTDELRDRTEAAEEANRAKARFLAAMSHDLRTPLNAIAGYAELLELGLRGPVTEQQLADLRRIRNSGRHLLALINGVLSFARIEAGRVEVRPEPVPLEALVSGAESSFLPQAAERGLTYTCDAGPRGVWVHADPDRAEQILLNLVGNAIKFTEPGGRVTVTCEDGETSAAVHVADTGRGIPPDQLARVFEPFVQVERDRTPDVQRGVGLGLAISRELALAMGGDLSVRSEVGKGSVFTLRLPRVPVPSRRAPDAAPAGVQPAHA
jgi:signal transduction histidine kinase